MAKRIETRPSRRCRNCKRVFKAKQPHQVYCNTACKQDYEHEAQKQARSAAREQQQYIEAAARPASWLHRSLNSRVC